MTHATRYPSPFLLLCIIAFPLIAAHAAAQEPALEECAGGRTYYVAYPDTVTNRFDDRFPPTHPESFTLLIYSPVNQQLLITRSDGMSTTLLVPENRMIEFSTKDIGVPMVTMPGVASNLTLKVEATAPIVVYAYLSTHFGSAAFTPVPVEGWGTEYIVMTWPGDVVRNILPSRNPGQIDATRKVAAPAEIVIIAAYDGTNVLIEPADSILPAARTVMLQAGQAYLVRSFVDTNEGLETSHDIAGTRITADKPIGVISGNTRAEIEPQNMGLLGGNSVKDLMAEWLHPVQSHGTEFVFLPTMDDFRPRPNADPVRESEFVRILPSTDAPTEIVAVGRYGDSSAVPVEEWPVSAPWVVTDTIALATAAHLYRTTAPASVYQSPKPVAQFNGTTGSGEFTGASFLSWGSYLVEATPRERWTNFAPFRAPAVQSTTKHYLNVVCDTADMGNIHFKQGTSPRQSFPFNRGRIAGTDLIWGSVTINPDVSYIIEGDGGARFSGYVYGYWGGFELSRPSRSTSTPGEYEEETAQMYAYPLASRHCSDPFVDDFDLDIENGECGEKIVTITTHDGDSPGIESVRLSGSGGMAVNTRMQFITPSDSNALASGRLTEVVIRLTPIDITSVANATVLIREKGTTLEQRLPYFHQPERFEVDPADSLHIENLSRGVASGSIPILLENSSATPITVQDVRLAAGDQGFEIVEILPLVESGTPALLRSGDRLRVAVVARPFIDEGTITDTLIIERSCGITRIPLSGTVKAPCLRIADLYFGRLGPGEQRMLPLQICNDGAGRAIFVDSSGGGGGDVLSWLGNEFTVSSADIDRLRGVLLGTGRCITVDVTFTAPASTGSYGTTARFWSNTRRCRDSSVWSARVDTTSGVDDELSVSGLNVTPNPATDELTVAFTLSRVTDLRIVLFDASGREAAVIEPGRLEAGDHRLPLDLSALSSGIYILRVAGLAARVVVVR